MTIGNDLGALGKDKAEAKAAQDKIIDTYREAMHSTFTGLNISMSTAAIWGKRIEKCACSENVIFALSDTGDIYSWGGNNHWWYEIQPDSKFQSKWRGDTTARSQLLLGTSNKVNHLHMDIINISYIILRNNRTNLKSTLKQHTNTNPSHCR
jgi:alpha-tubulin suppressor-like RCC1 family protein